MPMMQMPQLRDGQELDYEELAELARTKLNESEFTQREMAKKLGVVRPSIGKAVTQPGSQYQRLQMRIIEELTDFKFHMQTRFIAYKRTEADDRDD